MIMPKYSEIDEKLVSLSMFVVFCLLYYSHGRKIVYSQISCCYVFCSFVFLLVLVSASEIKASWLLSLENPILYLRLGYLREFHQSSLILVDRL